MEKPPNCFDWLGALSGGLAGTQIRLPRRHVLRVIGRHFQSCTSSGTGQAAISLTSSTGKAPRGLKFGWAAPFMGQRGAEGRRVDRAKPSQGGKDTKEVESSRSRLETDLILLWTCVPDFALRLSVSIPTPHTQTLRMGSVRATCGAHPAGR